MSNSSTTDASAGNVRVVDATAACKNNERALDWNAQGIQGPKGDKGDAGPQGPQGPSGIAKLTTRYVSFPISAGGESQKIINCDAGERPTGGGFSMNSDMRAITSQPYPPFQGTPEGWRLYAANDSAIDGIAIIWVICAAG